jgi:hypothetical protein
MWDPHPKPFSVRDWIQTAVTIALGVLGTILLGALLDGLSR